MSIIYEQIMGQWTNDKIDGRGVKIWVNGDRYERTSSKIIVSTFIILINISDIVNELNF